MDGAAPEVSCSSAGSCACASSRHLAFHTILVLALSLLAGASLAAAGDDAKALPSPRATVGLIRAGDDEVTRALAQGLELAFHEARQAGRADVRLLVSGPAPAWGTAGSEAVRLAFEEDALALVTPPERATSHVVAQVGTKSHVPILSTAPALSVTQAGSLWVFSVLPAAAHDAREREARPKPPALDLEDEAVVAFASRFEALHGRAPDGWAVAGHDAGQAIVQGLLDVGADRERLSRRLAEKTFTCRGAAGSFGFDERGRRR